MKKIINILIFFMLCSLSFAEIKIFVNDYNPTIKQNIILTVEFLNEPKSEYEIKGIEDFEIISEGSRSNYSAAGNKKIKYSKSDIYIISPKKEGKYSLLVKAKNKSVSNSIILKVEKENKISAARPKLFLETTHYSRDYYLGEKIPFVEKVIIKTSISNYNYISTPVFSGFSIKNITPRDGRGFPIPKRVTVNGKERIELVLFRSILEPENFGKKIIKTGGISIAELTENDKEKDPVYLGFREFNLNILPLPKENKPKNFQNIVGELKSDYKWTEEIIDGKKVFILNLKLYGSVNLDNLEKIISFQNDDFDIKESTIMFEEHVLDHVYSAEKHYIIAFIPKKEGDFIPPEIKIPFFNPIQKDYDEITISFSGFDENSENENLYSENSREKLKFIFAQSTEADNSVKNEKPNIKNLQQTKINDTISEKENKHSEYFVIIFLGVLAVLEGIYIIKLKKKISDKNK